MRAQEIELGRREMGQDVDLGQGQLPLARRFRAGQALQQRILGGLDRGVEIGGDLGTHDLLEHLAGDRWGQLADDQPAAVRPQPLGEPAQQLARHRVEPQHPPRVEDEALGAVEVLDHPAGQALQAGEGQVALQLVDDDAVALAIEQGRLLRAALAPGADLRHPVAAADHRARVAAVGQHVQAQLLRQVAADMHAAHAVAARVQQRREHADAELARLDRHDPAADPALGRQADGELPAAGEIVHAAGGHHAQHVADMVGAQRALAGDRVDAAIGERRRHHREVARRDQDRALHEIEVEMLLDIALDHAGIELEIGDRAVAVAGLDLRAVDPHVDVQRVADEALEGREHARAPLGLVRPLISAAAAMAPALTIGL